MDDKRCGVLRATMTSSASLHSLPLAQLSSAQLCLDTCTALPHHCSVALPRANVAPAPLCHIDITLCALPFIHPPCLKTHP